MTTDTIVAQATPPGLGALAVVRLSGPEAGAIASRLTGAGGSELEVRRPSLRTLVQPDSGEHLDRALVTLYPAPGSYTGEDLVEISTHGGYLIPRAVVDSCVALGAREARPGEFTERAFLNGKMDLTQAEATHDLISARAPRTAAVALHQLERGLGERVSQLRETLVGVEALLVQHVDFPEEDEAPVPLGGIAEAAGGIATQIARLVATAPSGELLREGVLTVLAGPPNAGKSSLFNALLGRERAIVTEEAGTTRDALEAPVSIAGFPFRLVDTAGLRGEGAGRVERMGIEVAERYLARADLVLYCKEVGDPYTSQEQRFLDGLAAPVILVRTMCDKDGAGAAGGGPEVRTSVRSGVGLDTLGSRMKDLVFQGVVEARAEVPVVTNERQRKHLEEARLEVQAFADALAAQVPPEAAQAHLKAAESALEEILGLISTEDVLDRVFREFCIGK